MVIVGNDNVRYHDTKTKFDYSEVVFNQALLALKEAGKDILQINLKSWRGKYIINENTQNVVKLFFPEERGENGVIQEGKRTYRDGDDAFIAIAGVETGQSKFYLLAQHPRAFKRKKVAVITVERKLGGPIRITYEYDS